MYFYYDESGRAFGFRAGDSAHYADYYYQYNLQGDIVGLLNASGNMVCRYVYDSWGVFGGAYDYNGNPLQYRDGMSFTWQAGRQLKSATVNGKTYTRQKTHIRPQQNMNKGRSEWGIFPTRFKFVEIKANTIYNNIGTQLYKSESVSLYYI